MAVRIHVACALCVMPAKLNHSDSYESIAKGQLVSPSLSQHVVMPIQARKPHCLIAIFRLNCSRFLPTFMFAFMKWLQ